MNTHNILTADEQYIKQLDSQKSVELFRDLIWAEANRLGIPPSKVTISLRTNVPDGGIDAEIDVDSITFPSSGLFEKGKNSYQIKAGISFKPQNKKDLKKELFDKKEATLENLASEVRACLEVNGKYTIVCFGIDLTPEERKKGIKNLQDYLKVCGFDKPQIDIWGTNNIKGFIQKYPSITLQTNRMYDEPFKTLNEWANTEDMRVSFETGSTQKEVIENIRNHLRRNDSPSQLRILGEAGVGKTRLLLEATNIEDISPLVIYTLASDFDGSRLLTGLMRNEALHAIIIVDECDSDQRARLWNNLKFHYPRIKLVTIFNEWDTGSHDTVVHELSGLLSDQISAIIQSYGIPKFEADRWVEDCGGSPRVAHVVGENIKSNPDDILKPPSHVNIWDRYICGRDMPDSENARQRRIVLQHIALFKRFGYGKPLSDEAKTIQKLIQNNDIQITQARFRNIVEKLKAQHILQGITTLYITPKLLHIKLWIDWWNLHGDDFDVNQVTEFPPRLIEWFFEMFKYAEGSPSASQTAKELLSENGVFQGKGDSLRERFGASFFSHLAQAEPVFALKCLQRTIGTWSKDELATLDQTRGFITSSLEYIALWQNLFQDAARLLLLLGEVENQNYSNNASGVFAELFQLSEYKELSKSEATPSQRIQVLQEVLTAASPEARKLGINACKKALSWKGGGFIRASHRIVGKKPNLWYPKTYGELFDAYRDIWKLLLDNLEDFDKSERKLAFECIMESASNLARIHLLNEMVLKDLERLYENGISDNEKELLIATILRFTHYHGKEIPNDNLEQWNRFQKKLTGSNYHDSLVRYIAMDLIIDINDDSGNITDKIDEKIQELADYGLSNKNELLAELPWLMSNDFYQARNFATVLGKKDNKRELLSFIVQLAKELRSKRTPAAFLGSYLRDNFLKDNEGWTKLIHFFSKDDDLVYVVPMVIWHSRELTNDLAMLLINLVKLEKISLLEFRLFEYVDFSKVSQDVINKWFDILLSQNDVAFSLIALSTHHHLYVHGKAEKIIPEELTLRLLTHPMFYTSSDKIRYDQMGEYHWTRIAERFIEQFPNRALEISNALLEHFSDDNTWFGRIFSETHHIVGRVAQLHPKQVWNQISKYLTPPYDDRAFGITHWLHGESEVLGNDKMTGPLDIFPPSEIWEWVNENIDQRAWYLASFIPKALHRETDKVCWARELLIKYGDLESVRKNLHANFASGSWSGSASQYFMRKQETAINFRKGETNSNVLQWLDEYINILEKDIERERIREERDDY